MKVQSRTKIPQKHQKTEVTMTKKAKVSLFFRPTVLLDHAASRLVKIIKMKVIKVSFGAISIICTNLAGFEPQT